MRLNVPHEELQDEVECPGCKILLQRDIVNQHLRGCARIPGRNASNSHQQLKNGTGRMAWRRCIGSEAAEPKGFEVQWCSPCRTFVRTEEAASHCADAGCSQQALSAARKVRPDKRFFLRAGTIVTDETNVGILTKSNLNETSISSILDKRLHEKNKRYLENVMREGEAFFCISSTPNGNLSEDTVHFCALLAKESPLPGDSAKEVENEFRRHICLASGSALLNAERILGVYSRKTPNPILPPSLAPETYAATLPNAHTQSTLNPLCRQTASAQTQEHERELRAGRLGGGAAEQV
jgi:hypothetical protein